MAGSFGPQNPTRWTYVPTVSGGAAFVGMYDEFVASGQSSYAAFGNPVLSRWTYVPTVSGGAALVAMYDESFVDPAQSSAADGMVGSQSPTGVAPQYRFVFDTIGQTIFRTIGHCRTPMRIIWAQGIEASDDTVTSSTISFAAAICAPIDPDEEGTIVGISAGGTALFDSSGVTVPDGMTDETAALLTASINNAIVYPGDEAQEPAPLIVADKGASVTNAFRGIRYILFPDWPLDAGLPSNMALRWERTNDITLDYSSAAVEFP